MSCRCACISGLSEASIAADDARRYSRMIGFSRCESVYGNAGQLFFDQPPERLLRAPG